MNSVYQKITAIFPKFKEYIVKFKQFDQIDKDLSFIDNKIIYFSSEKLKEKLSQEWQFWIFIKILKLLNIKIEDHFGEFRKVLAKGKHKRTSSSLI